MEISELYFAATDLVKNYTNEPGSLKPNEDKLRGFFEACGLVSEISELYEANAELIIKPTEDFSAIDIIDETITINLKESMGILRDIVSLCDEANFDFVDQSHVRMLFVFRGIWQ